MKWLSSLVLCFLVHVAPCLGDAVGVASSEYMRHVESVECLYDSDGMAIQIKLVLDDGLEFLIKDDEFMGPLILGGISGVRTALSEVRDPVTFERIPLENASFVRFMIEDVQTGFSESTWGLIGKLFSFDPQTLPDLLEELKDLDDRESRRKELIRELAGITGKVSLVYQVGNQEIIQSCTFYELSEIFHNSAMATLRAGLEAEIVAGDRVSLDYDEDQIWKLEVFDEDGESKCDLECLLTDQSKEVLPKFVLYIESIDHILAGNRVILSDGTFFEVLHYADAETASNWDYGDRLVVNCEQCGDSVYTLYNVDAQDDSLDGEFDCPDSAIAVKLIIPR